jgi:DNA repair protein RecO (recombination protein O)
MASASRAKPEVFLDEGVCVRQWEWSETSQTLSIFTREHGMVRVLAKGSRRPRSPYSGGVEILTRGRCSVLPKKAGLALLTEWDLQETFPRLRESLLAHRAGLYALEVMHLCVQEDDPHPALYDALVRSLRAIGQGTESTEKTIAALAGLNWGVLVETGHQPRLGGDDRTPRATECQATAYRFDPEAGCILADDMGAVGWRVRPETVETLRTLATTGSLEATGMAAERAGRLLAAYVRYVLGVQPRTMADVFGPDLPL